MPNFIPQIELQDRRNKLTDLMVDGSVFILLSASLINRNADVEYPFRQNSSFWYLTGLDIPNCALLISKKNGLVAEYIYTQDRNLSEEMWLGKRFSQEEVTAITGIKKLENIKWFSELVPDIRVMIADYSTVYFDLKGDYSSIRTEIFDYIFSSSRRTRIDNLETVIKTRQLIQQLRLIKSPWEIEQMEEASRINILAHEFANARMTDAVKNGQVYSEKLFEADLYYKYNQNGVAWSYPAIVATGSNGCILHYGKNNDTLKNDQFLLVDAGCEYNYYASDITRVYHPIGNYTEAQANIYNLVLETNKALIEFLGSGEATYLNYHTKSIELVSAGLLKLDLLKGSLESIIQNGDYKKFYMHGIGHWIGLDVHDDCQYLNSNGTRIDTKLVEGMCVTVEPGIYILEDDETVPLEYRGIAVRIEDDIVITRNGIINLTENLSKSLNDKT